MAALVREEKMGCCVGTPRPVPHTLLWHRQDPAPSSLPTAQHHLSQLLSKAPAAPPGPLPFPGKTGEASF